MNSGVAGGSAQRPRVDEVRTRSELGALLSEQRRRSGYSLRQLAAEVGSSASTISGWCRAENLPFPSQYDVFAAMLERLGVQDTDPWLELVDDLRTAGATNGGDQPPYRGLEPFRTQDAELFFGRARLVEEIHARIDRIAANHPDPSMLLLVGPSGSGKSSLLHAGVRPRLRAAGVPCRTLTPGAEPLARLQGATPDAPDAPDATAPPIAQAVLVDQFEEVFTACDDLDQREGFLAELERIATGEPGDTGMVVASLRVDFYQHLVASGYLEAALEHAQVIVGGLARDQLHEVIVEPARRAGVSVDADLVESLIRDFLPAGMVRSSPAALPLLSHALLETWRRSRRARMTLEDYRQAGGLRHAVERSAEEAFGGLQDDERPLARQMLVRMVNLEPDAPLSRRPLTYDKLLDLDQADVQSRVDVQDEVSDGQDPTQAMSTRAQRVLDRFVAARLVTVYERTIEISHEVLLTSWPRLRDWIEQSEDMLRVQRRVAEAARMWQEHDREHSGLLRGKQLAAARAIWDDENPTVVLAATEREFLAASIEQDEQDVIRERQVRRRLRMLVAAVSTLALLAGMSAVVAVDARSNALAVRDEALSREIAVTASRVAETDPSLAAQLAVAGYAVSPTRQARSALLDASASMQVARYLGGPGSIAMALSDDGTAMAVSDATAGHVQLFRAAGSAWERTATMPLADPEAESFALEFNRAGDTLFVGDTTAAIGVWDVGELDAPQSIGTSLQGPDGPIQGLAVSPDGGELSAVGLGDGVFRWDISDPQQPAALPLLPSDEITWSVAYDLTGERLAVGDDVGAVQVWELGQGSGSEPELVASLDAGDRSVLSVAFGADDGLLVAGSRSGDIHVWDLDGATDPQPVEVPEDGFDSWVNSVRFSGDGQQLAAASSDGDLRVWSTDTWGVTATLPHPAAVTGVRFSPGDASLLSVATDGTARDWDLASAPTSVAGRVWSLAFTDEGDELAAFSSPQTAVWDLADDLRNGPLTASVAPPDDGPVFSGAGAMSADGALLAHGTFSGEVVLYDRSQDPGSPEPFGPYLAGSDQLVEAVEFSPDGRWVAAGGVDTDIRLWRVDGAGDGMPTVVLDDPGEIVLNLAWSDDGDLLAASSADNHVYLYDVSDPTSPHLASRLGGFDSEAYGAAFDPAGTRLAAAGSDGIVLLWDLSDVDDPRLLASILEGPAGRIFDLAIHPGGDLLAAAVTDGSVWVWDVSDVDAIVPLAALRATGSPIYAVAFDPTSEQLVASGADQAIYRWHLDDEAAVNHVCANVGDAISPEEWRTFLADHPYLHPCGTPSR